MHQSANWRSGFLAEGTFEYADESGFDLDNQALVFRVQLPPNSFRGTSSG